MAEKIKNEVKLTDMTKEELVKLAGEVRGQIVKAMREMSTGKLRNLRLGFNLKKKLARVLTVLQLKAI